MAVHTDVWTSQVQYELDAARAEIGRLREALEACLSDLEVYGCNEMGNYPPGVERRIEGARAALAQS